MQPNLLVATVVMGMGLMLAAGCGQTYYPDSLDATLEQVDLIRNSDTLEPEEKREELAELLGVEEPSDPNSIGAVILNGLLEGERLANQFGGDLSSAYGKVVGNEVDDNQLSEMTPDEVQFYADATEQLTEDLSDAEAQAIVDFFRGNDIDSVDELEDWLDNPANELPVGVDEENLRAVFIDASTDEVRDKL